jgi:predicted transposase YbfD/YdcC
MPQNGEVVEMTETPLHEKLSKVPDYRSGNAIKHVLSDVLLIAILTFLTNGTTYADMRVFAEVHMEKLKGVLQLPNGIPSQDTFEHIFARLNPRALKSVLREYVGDIKTLAMNQGLERVVASIDGKTECGSGSKCEGRKAKHIVSAFASQLRLVLGEVAVDEKSNEITAIPRLLELFCQKGMLITIDAMGTQTNIAETIIGKEADYVLSVKKNQPTLFNDVSLAMEAIEFSATKGIRLKLKEAGLYDRTSEKGHGRHEIRECFICTDLSLLSTAHDWKGITGFGVIVSSREELNRTDRTPCINREYFIYSLDKTNATEMLSIKRSHWAIENNLHWSLDVILKEDDSRARLDNAPENLNIIRKEVLQRLQSDKTAKGSVRSKLYRCSQCLDYAFSLLGVK